MQVVQHYFNKCNLYVHAILSSYSMEEYNDHLYNKVYSML